MSRIVAVPDHVEDEVFVVAYDPYGRDYSLELRNGDSYDLGDYGTAIRHLCRLAPTKSLLWITEIIDRATGMLAVQVLIPDNLIIQCDINSTDERKELNWKPEKEEQYA